MSGTPHFVNRWTQCATLITITAGTFGVSEALRGPTPLFWLLSSIYLALLTCGVYALERSPGRVELSLYFVSSSALLIGLLYMSRASAWLMGLPLLSHMALFLPWQLALLWGTAFLGVLLLLANVASKELAAATANTGAAILFVLAFSVMARRQVQWRLRAEALSASLQSANARLRDLALEAEELSAMRERNRVAREVHDGLGHYLTTIHVQLEAARALLARDLERARQGIERAQLLARQGLQDVRESVGVLRNGPTSQPSSLEEALTHVIAVHTEQGQRPRATLELQGAERSLSQGVHHALRRVLQEALTNVQRHANASAVQVVLAFESERVTMEVCDDGRGRVQQPNGPCSAVGPGSALGPCSAVGPGSAVGENRAVGEGSAHQGYGLSGICERIHALGGQVTFGNRAAGGFRLAVTVPT